MENWRILQASTYYEGHIISLLKKELFPLAVCRRRRRKKH
jgi:hypothetical protein